MCVNVTVRHTTCFVDISTLLTGCCSSKTWSSSIMCSSPSTSTALCNQPSSERDIQRRENIWIELHTFLSATTYHCVLEGSDNWSFFIHFFSILICKHPKNNLKQLIHLFAFISCHSYDIIEWVLVSTVRCGVQFNSLKTKTKLFMLTQ